MADWIGGVSDCRINVFLKSSLNFCTSTALQNIFSKLKITFNFIMPNYNFYAGMYYIQLRFLLIFVYPANYLFRWYHCSLFVPVIISFCLFLSFLVILISYKVLYFFIIKFTLNVKGVSYPPRLDILTKTTPMRFILSISVKKYWAYLKKNEMAN